MDELQSITDKLSTLPAESVCALATLVHVEGSSYRSVGARALALPGGDTIGMISGGCLEGDLLERADQVLADGHARTVRYDSTAPEDALLGLGLGCNGVVDVLLERVAPADAVAGGRYLPRIAAARARGHRSALATVYESAYEAEVGARGWPSRTRPKPRNRRVRPTPPGTQTTPPPPATGGRSCKPP